MRLFMFKSNTRDELHAFAGKSNDERLPSKFGPWESIGVVRSDEKPPHNFSRDDIEKAITDEGFQLFRIRSKTPMGD
ncbi:MAG: hypothetical protein ACR2OX_02205 [Methyloligellaceae bacterium]